jgi:branched-chain amino acid transport system substrate-binding protein
VEDLSNRKGDTILQRSGAIRAIAALLTTSSLSIESAPAAQADPEPYAIPVMVSTTGNFAFIGKQEVQSLGAVASVVNKTGGIRGRPLRFTFRDVQSSPVVTLQVANGVLAEHPPVVLGPDSTAQTSAILPLLTSHQTVVYTFSPAFSGAPGGDVFSMMLSNYDLFSAGIRYLRQKGLTRIAVLNTTDASGVDQLQQFQRVIALPENRGVTMAANESFAITDLNVSAQLSRIRAARPQALLIGTTGTAFGTALHALTDTGYDVPVLTNAGNINRQQIAQYASFMPETVYFTGSRFMGYDIESSGPVKRAQKLFYDSLNAVGVPKVDFGNASCWDAAWIIVDALRKFGPAMTGPQLHSYIENLHDYAGINGVMDFRGGNQRGIGVDAALIVLWNAKKQDWIPVSTFGGNPLTR